MANDEHKHNYSPSGSEFTVKVGNMVVTWQRMECSCGDAYNQQVSSRPFDPESN